MATRAPAAWAFRSASCRCTTAAGGIHPANTLPILLDCGTNNQERLKDPLYIGWRHERITGDDYLEFVDIFVQAVKKRWPDVLLQFEDFAIQNAVPLLEKYRDQLCMFNDDVQGTAAVAVGTLLAASKVAGTRMRDHRVAFLGAGSAGAGIAEQTIRAMVADGLHENEARSRIFMVDRYGLLHDKMDGLAPFQAKLAQPHDAVAGWADAKGEIGLASVVEQARPTVLIGVCGQPGLFTEAIVKAMAKECERPIVFPMSNPTSRAEATPKDIIHWTDGKALVATGSPFDPVDYKGTSYTIAQSNNTYVFPGVGARRHRRPCDARHRCHVHGGGPGAGGFDSGGGRSRRLAAARRQRYPQRLPVVAIAVVKQAQADGVAPKSSEEDLIAAIDATQWQPDYA